MSVLLRPNIQPSQAPMVTVLTGTAVASALNSLGFSARIKWPNDILIGEKKVCGILTEMDAEMSRVNHIITGIGMNVNNDVSKFPNGLRETVTTLRQESGGKPVDRPRVLLAVLTSLKHYTDLLTDPSGQGPALDDWRGLSDTMGRKVRVEMVDRSVEGTAVDIDDEGALLVDTKDGRERVLSGDCVHLR